MKQRWPRVTRNNRCPVCGSDHWCAFSPDGAFVNCPRTPARKVLTTADGEFVGYLHRIKDGAAAPPREAPEPPPAVPRAELELMARRFRTSCPPDRLKQFAAELGVNVTPLRRLEAGCNTDRARRIWTFPMFDDERRVVGISCRAPGGGKFCVRGSSMGLFLPSGLKGGGDLVSPEGATSTAAALCWGLEAAGRFSNSGGAVLLGRLAERLGAARVVLLSENDLQFNENQGCWLWPGLDGAALVARALARRWPRLEVRIVLPPELIKDAREWLQYGAGRGEVLGAIGREWMTAAEAAAVSAGAKRDAARVVAAGRAARERGPVHA